MGNRSTHERGERKTFLFLIQLDDWQTVDAESGGDFAAVMDVVFEHADRILVLNRGSLIAEGSPEEVRGNAQVRAIYLGEGLLYDARHREGASA